MTGPDPRVTDVLIDGLLLDTSPYLSCDACFEQLDTYVEAIVADPEHRDVAMRLHLAACGACAEEAAALAELVQGRDG